MARLTDEELLLLFDDAQHDARDVFAEGLTAEPRESDGLELAMADVERAVATQRQELAVQIVGLVLTRRVEADKGRRQWDPGAVVAEVCAMMAPPVAREPESPAAADAG